MARRDNEKLVWMVASIPWWVGVVLAAVVYLALRYVLPALAPASQMMQGLARAVSEVAWVFTLPFLIGALFSAIKGGFKKRLLDQQRDIESIRDLSWQQFELLVSEAFRRQGYTVEDRGGSAPDGGVDLVLRKGGRTAVVQCKRWKTTQVGVSPVRELFGVMTAERADEAVFVSSGDYTVDARAFADGKPIRLIDGPALAEMVADVQANPPTSSAARNVAPSPAPPAPAATETPLCPKCGSAMVRRVAKQGANAGQEFWGCPKYPQCRGTRAL